MTKPADSQGLPDTSSEKPVNAGDDLLDELTQLVERWKRVQYNDSYHHTDRGAGREEQAEVCADELEYTLKRWYEAAQPPAASPVEDCGECGHRVDAGECPECGPLEAASPVDGDAGESKTLKAAIYWMERSNKAEGEVRRLREESRRHREDGVREAENAMRAEADRDRLATELERRNVAHVEPAIIARDRDDWKQRAQEAERDRDLFRNASEAAELRIVELRKELAELQAIYDGLCK